MTRAQSTEGRRDPSMRRRAELARIHLQAQQLGLDEDTYRAMLRRLTGRDSAGEMTDAERAKVLDFMRRQLGARRYPGRPHNADADAAQAPGLRKIEALLAEAGRPWAYADAIARRVAGVERCAFLDAAGARKVIPALCYDAKRHGRRTA